MSHKYERVTFTQAPISLDRLGGQRGLGAGGSNATTASYLPRIGTSSSSDKTDEVQRPFRADDFPRVLDFEDMPEVPPDCTMLHCESSGGSAGLESMRLGGGGGGPSDPDGGVSFPRRHGALRGAFIFYFGEDDVEDGGKYYAAPPSGVIPIDRCDVEFPPGGRRVFREHAHTDARNGYEMMIRHRGGGRRMSTASTDSELPARPPVFLVLESLGQRELWAAAIRIRAEAHMKDTKLRPGTARDQAPDRGVGGRDELGPGRRIDDRGVIGGEKSNPFADDRTPAAPKRAGDTAPGEGAATPADGGRMRRRRSCKPSSLDQASGRFKDGAPAAGAGGGGGVVVDGVEVNASALGVSGEDAEDVDSALRQFGRGRFDENLWADEFFQGHNEFDAPSMCQTLERWQAALKKGLRGAVLEQYEYFVEASKEMTTMGREVATLRSLVDNQRETIEAMKNIDFAAAFADPVADDYGYSSDEGEEDEGKEDGSELSSVASSHSDSTGWGRGDKSAKGSNATPKGAAAKRQSRRSSLADSIKKGMDQAGTEPHDNEEGDGGTLIEIPDWLGDVTEEISAFIKECRYTDATELILKAKVQVNEILNQHEKLTELRLSKKQLANMQRILHDIEGLTDRVGNRLAEGLRRKNEALKLAAKRERADPLSVLAPLVSPICLSDDATALQLLVKLGRPQDAATAYAARRSLLLMESLHERPISSTGSSGTMDVVIYAAQLSQSFFSCLAAAVEGFLDLFLDGDSSGGGDSSDPEEMSSIHSAVGKRVPAGAIAAVVLWCDSELSKFAAAFGGTRVLGNLALGPPPRADGGSGEKTKGTDPDALRETQILEVREKLREAEEKGQYAVAASMRQKMAEMEKEEEAGGRRGVGRRATGDDRTQKTTAIDSKERQAAIDVTSKCVDQAFQFASENLDSIGLPLTPRLAEYIRARLKGCEAEIAANLEGKWDHVTFDWANNEGTGGIEEDPRRGRRTDLRRSSPGND